MIRHRTAFAIAAAALLVTTGVVVGVTSASAAGTVTATFTKVQDWGTGYEGKYTITNGTSSAITSWRVVFTMPSTGTVGTFWEAVITRSGDTYTAVNANWNGTVAAGAVRWWAAVAVRSWAVAVVRRYRTGPR